MKAGSRFGIFPFFRLDCEPDLGRQADPFQRRLQSQKADHRPFRDCPIRLADGSLSPLVSLELMPQNCVLSKRDIDDYLAGIEEPKKRTLQALRRTILEVLPDAEQCITYNLPTFKVNGKAVAGFAAFKNHCSYFPMSGSVLPELRDDVARYKTSSGALQFATDRPLPKRLVKKLIRVRLAQAFPDTQAISQVNRTIGPYPGGSPRRRHCEVVDFTNTETELLPCQQRKRTRHGVTAKPSQAQILRICHLPFVICNWPIDDPKTSWIQ